MKKHNINPPTDCTTHTCDWAHVEPGDENSESYLACVQGSGDCMPFNLLAPEEPSGGFFDDPLSNAVQQMKAIASALTPPDDNYTYTLSLINVPLGVVPEQGATLMLGWVRHGEKLPSGVKHNVVTAKSSPEAIARALGLKKRESQEK